jgi:hypothetical protein
MMPFFVFNIRLFWMELSVRTSCREADQDYLLSFLPHWEQNLLVARIFAPQWRQ